MISVIQNNDVYEIRFPYDVQIIELVKAVPGRRWEPNGKFWTIPLDRLGFLIREFQGTVYEQQLNIQSEENINVNSSLDATVSIPDIDISDVKQYVKEGFHLYPHQVDFMKYAIARQTSGNMRGFILCDSPGLGKTLESTNLALYNKSQYGFKRCLIVCCINSSKYNWQNDIEIHTNREYQPYILGSRLKKDGSINTNTGSKEKLYDLEHLTMYGKDDTLPYFNIINIEAIRYKVGKTYPIADAIIKMINEDELSMIIIDEVHKNMSMHSHQGQQISRIHKNSKKQVMWISMTGTPIVNKPTDVFLPLKLIDAHNFTSYYKWCENFCVYGGFGDHEIIGYKNIPKLKDMLQLNMLRRLKEDVLDLPPKTEITEYVTNTSYQQKLYKQVVGELVADADNILVSLNPLASFLRLRQVNGSPEIVDNDLKLDSQYISKNAKLQRLLELLEEIHANGEKVVIFSNWVEPLRTLYRIISKKYKTCCFVGTMTPEAREQHKRVFQNNPEYTVLLGTIGAAGTTHTFTAATNAIFYDEPWTPSDKLQASDRIYRIGTNKSVNIYTLITKDTVDEKVHSLLYTKDQVSKYIVDSLDIRKNPELLKFLLGK